MSRDNRGLKPEKGQSQMRNQESMKAPGQGGITKPLGMNKGNAGRRRFERSTAHDGDQCAARQGFGGPAPEHDYDESPF